MQAGGYTKQFVKDLAKRKGIDVKGKTVPQIYNLVKADIPPPKPLTKECDSKPLSRLHYQGKELGGININLYSEKNKQDLCDQIRERLDETKSPDKFANVPSLPPKEQCKLSLRNKALAPALLARGVRSPTTNADLLKIAKLLGIKDAGSLDRSTLCFLMKEEMREIDRTGKIKDVEEKKSGAGSYENFVLPDESMLTIPELSRSLPQNDTREIILSEQQILPAVYMARPESTGLILQHDVGTGKTFAAINTSQVLLRRGVVKKVIIITPTSLQNNFKDQFRQYNKVLATDTRYEYYTPNQFLNRVKTSGLQAREDTLLIIDEAHNYRTNIWAGRKKNAMNYAYTDIEPGLAGAKTRAIFQFLLNPFVKKVLLLTATPFVNYYYDIENLIAMVERREPAKPPKKLPDDFDIRTLYKDKCLVHMYETPLEEQRLFPRVIKKTQLYEMSPEYYQDYYQIQTDTLNGKYEMFQSGNLGVFYNGVRRAANSLDKKGSAASQKLNALLQKVKDNIAQDPEIRILIYSTWIEAGLNSIQTYFQTEGIRSASVIGSFSKQHRKESVEKFNAGQVNVLLISRAGGEGLDLKGTNIVYIVDPTWNDASISQIIGRAVRRGSHLHLPEEKRVVNVISMVLLKPFEGEIKTRRADMPDLFDKVFLDNKVLGNYEDVESQFDAGIKNRRLAEDNIMSIDLYLHKFMKKKQEILDRFIEQTRQFSDQCFGDLMNEIKSEVERFVPVDPIDVSKVKALMEETLALYGEQFSTIVDLPMSQKPESSSDYPIYEAKDIPARIRVNASAELQSLAPDRKLRCVLQRSIPENAVRLVCWYRGSQGNVIREIVRI